VSVYRSQGLVLSSVKRSGRQVLKIVIQALWDVALFQLIKSDFPQGKMSYIFRSEQLKNNGILF